MQSDGAADSAAGASAAEGAGSAGLLVETLNRAVPGAGAAVATGADVGGGGTTGGGGFGDAGVGVSELPRPNSCRINWLTASEESSPQAGQIKCTPVREISGVRSKEYFAPQEHWTFMLDQGWGFSRTTP